MRHDRQAFSIQRVAVDFSLLDALLIGVLDSLLVEGSGPDASVG